VPAWLLRPPGRVTRTTRTNTDFAEALGIRTLARLALGMPVLARPGLYERPERTHRRVRARTANPSAACDTKGWDVSGSAPDWKKSASIEDWPKKPKWWNKNLSLGSPGLRAAMSWGVFLVVAPLLVFFLATGMTQASLTAPIKCGDLIMSPGDICTAGYDYGQRAEQNKESAESNNGLATAALRVGQVAIPLGAVLIVGAVSRHVYLRRSGGTGRTR